MRKGELWGAVGGACLTTGLGGPSELRIAPERGFSFARVSDGGIRPPTWLSSDAMATSFGVSLSVCGEGREGLPRMRSAGVGEGGSETSFSESKGDPPARIFRVSTALRAAAVSKLPFAGGAWERDLTDCGVFLAGVLSRRASRLRDRMAYKCESRRCISCRVVGLSSICCSLRSTTYINED